MGPADIAKRTSVERLSPLQSARPPSQPALGTAARSPSPVASADGTQIVSRPPALDPSAEAWAARFDTVPPPAPVEPEAPRKRSGRWKTQVMGSMVPIEVAAAREERAPASEEALSYPGQVALVPEVLPAKSQPPPRAPGLIFHDVPSGWSPKLEAETPIVTGLREAVLKQTATHRVTVAVTGSPGPDRAKIAASLALSLAQNGAQVLLIEADFDRPELHETLSVSAPPGGGFSQQLRARKPDAQAAPWLVVRCSVNLQVLVESRMRSPGMLASTAFETAIQELRGQHHVVVFHAPALANPVNLRPLAGLCDAVVVANKGETPTIQRGEGALRALL